MRRSRSISVLAMAALLGSCGDGGSGTTSTAGTSTTTTTTTTTGCTLVSRQNFAFNTLKEWYLFPDTLPATLDPSPYSDVGSYIDALTATARAQGHDRYFTYVTSIAAENAYYASGSSAGFGFRIASDGGSRIFVAEAFEGTAALAAGIDRGTEILAIGNDSNSLKSVASLIASGGTAAVTTALGDSTVGLSRALQVSINGVTKVVTLSKTNYNLDPVSSRYGALTLNTSGTKVGYINLRTFITSGDAELTTAIANFKAQGITQFIVDLRYNGGGLISSAETLADLLGGNRAAGDVVDYTTFRPEKVANNTMHAFTPNANSASPTKIAFIGTDGTASASELVINAFTPYLGTNAALIGTNTYGKPVGQVAIDNTACDDRIRVIAFAVSNGAKVGGYYTGLASTVNATCAATDDISYPLGDPREASVKQALAFLAGTPCTAITASAGSGALHAATSKPQQLLQPTAPNTPQREVPGSF